MSGRPSGKSRAILAVGTKVGTRSGEETGTEEPIVRLVLRRNGTARHHYRDRKKESVLS